MKKTPSGPAGPCDLGGVCLAGRRARRSTPPSGGFFRFHCAANRHARTIAANARDVNEIPVAIHAAETSHPYAAYREFHRMFTMTPALDIRGLHKSFDRPAVAGLDLTVRAGEF